MQHAAPELQAQVAAVVSYPIRLARPAGNKALGFVTYLLAALGLGLFVTLAGGAVVYALLAALGASKSICIGIGWAAGGLGFSGVVAWAVRDFRQRAFFELLVHHDQIEVGTGGERLEMPFSRILTVRIERSTTELACVLVLTDGQKQRIPHDMAPFTRVRDALQAGLIPELTRRLAAEIAGGGTVRVRDFRGRAASLIPYALFLLLVAPVIMVRHPSHGLRMCAWARRCMRQGRRALRGGFDVSTAGFVPRSGGDRRLIPWESIARVQLDPDGIVLTTHRNEILSASPYADNFWPAARGLTGTPPLREAPTAWQVEHA